MQILELEVVQFGCLKEVTIPIDSQLQAIYGDNGIGKTTLYNFIRTIFFGFPSKRSKRHDYTPLAGGAFGGRIRVRTEAFGEVVIERFKQERQGKAVVYNQTHEEIGDEVFLNQLLSPLTVELFDEMYSLQQEELYKINQLQEEDLQKFLLSIGLSGSRKMMDLKESFEKEQGNIYKPNGVKPELNNYLEEYSRIQELIEEKEADEAAYQEKVGEQLNLEQLIEQEKNHMLAQKTQRDQLNQQLVFWEHYDEWQKLKLELEQEDPRLFSHDLKDIEKIYGQYTFTKQQELDYLNEQAYIKDSDITPAYTFYLEHQEACQEALARRIDVEKREDSLKRLAQQKNEQIASCDQLQQDLQIKDARLAFYPNIQEVTQIQQWSLTENELMQQQTATENLFDQEMEKQEALENEKLEKDWFKIGNGLPIGAILGAGITLLLMLKKHFILGIAIGFISLIAVGVAYYLQEQKKKQKVIAKQYQEVSDRVDKLADKIANYQERQKEMDVFKQQLAESYQFSIQKSLRDWLAELPLRDQLKKHLEKVEELTEEITRLNLEQESDISRIQFMKEWLPVSSEPNISTLYQALADYVEEMEAKRLAEAQKLGEEQWYQMLRDIQKRKADLEAQLVERITLFNLSEVEDIPVLLHRSQELKIQVAREKELRQSLEPIFDLNEVYTQEGLKESERQLNEGIENSRRHRDSYEKQLQGVLFTIGNMEADGKLPRLYQEKSNIQSKLEELALTWGQYRIGSLVIQDILDFLSDQQLPSLLEKTCEYFAQLTDNRYKDIQLKEGKLVILGSENQSYQLGELSTGTRDQLYISLRMAFIILQQAYCVFPLIIDDGWLNYDDRRKGNLFQLLTKVSLEQPIICMSSDQAFIEYCREHNHPIFSL